MYILPNVFLFLIGALIALAMTISALVVSYILLLTKFKHGEKEKILLKDQMQQNAIILLDNAHKEAIQVIASAHEKAKEILASTTNFSDESKTYLASEINKLMVKQEQLVAQKADEIMRSYDGLLKNLEKDSNTILTQIAKELEKKALTEVEDFQKSLEMETIHAQDIVKQKLEERYKNLDKDIEAYRDTKLKKIDENIYQLLNQIIKDVLGKSITLETHKELVLRALNEAKQDITVHM